MAEVLPPLPLPSEDDKPHWEGLRRHQLLIQKCNDCGTLQHPGWPMCPACHSMNRGWVQASGRGTVYSYTVVHREIHRDWPVRPPWNIAIVELEEDVRVISNLVDIPNEDIRIGLPVEVVYDDVTADVTLARFRSATI